MPAYGPGRPLPVSDKGTQWPHEWTVIKPMLPNKARGELAASDLGFIQLASIKLWLRGNKSTPTTLADFFGMTGVDRIPKSDFI